MKKNYYLISLIIGAIILPLFLCNSSIDSSKEDELEKQKEELLNRVSDDEYMKKDLLESILEFADEDTPIDSLE